MPARDGLFSSPGKPVSYTDSRAQQPGGMPTAADNSFTSALDSSPLRPAALRRRGSDGGSSASRGNSMSSYHARSRTMENTSDPHPLRRSSSSITRTVRHDMGSTRPRLSRALTPSTPNLSHPNPPNDKAEGHRAVVVHEVRRPFFLSFSVERLLTRNRHVLRSRRMIHSLASPSNTGSLSPSCAVPISSGPPTRSTSAKSCTSH